MTSIKGLENTTDQFNYSFDLRIGTGFNGHSRTNPNVKNTVNIPQTETVQSLIENVTLSVSKG